MSVVDRLKIAFRSPSALQQDITIMEQLITMDTTHAHNLPKALEGEDLPIEVALTLSQEAREALPAELARLDYLRRASRANFLQRLTGKF